MTLRILTLSIRAAYQGIALNRARVVTLGVPYHSVFDPPGAKPMPPGIQARTRF